MKAGTNKHHRAVGWVQNPQGCGHCINNPLPSPEHPTYAMPPHVPLTPPSLAANSHGQAKPQRNNVTKWREGKSTSRMRVIQC